MVRVVENPKIKFDGNSKLSFVPSKGSKTYEAYMIKQYGASFRDFNNNFYIYCKSVKDYLQRDNFQKDTNIIDYVSNLSIAEEFVLDGETDLDYIELKRIINNFNKNKIDKNQLKEDLAEIIKVAKNKEIKEI